MKLAKTPQDHGFYQGFLEGLNHLVWVFEEFARVPTERQKKAGEVSPLEQFYGDWEKQNTKDSITNY